MRPTKTHRSLFVRNLPYGVTNDEILKLASQYFKVRSMHIVLDRETGRSTGYGFLELEHPEDLNRAVEELDGILLNGRPLHVKVAEPRK